jgi:dihydroorotate dehydrogenase (fumarate)
MAFPSLNPPLLNSSNRWATTESELKALYECPYTGAITIRTSTLKGFQHDDRIHQSCFFEGDTMRVSGSDVADALPKDSRTKSSLNTYGYSPTTLDEYIDIILRIESKHTSARKPIIFSVTGTAREIVECLKRLASRKPEASTWLMEINLSCPNIPGKPPPAYSSEELGVYLLELEKAKFEIESHKSTIPVGLKTPPYTYQGQFDTLISALEKTDLCLVSFITATNTLGSSLVLDSETLNAALASAAGTGIGGLAGAALHPLALGNVKILRSMLDSREKLKKIALIGTGGVADEAGFKRMMSVGAAAVGVGTALGIDGIDIFAKILGKVVH